MIEKSFRFLPGVGTRTEQAWHARGIGTWNKFLETAHIEGISSARKKYLDRKLLDAKLALYERNASFFLGLIEQKDMFLLYPSFRERAIFVDIETSGTSRNSYVTVIGLYDGTHIKTLVRGVNLDAALLRKTMRAYDLVVTFNGACFDVPYLKRWCPGLFDGMLHFDVRFACARLGLSGGLKQIEHQLGLRRPQLVDGLHGGDALTLWRMFEASQDPYYLELLVEYNAEDVINLLPLADFVCKKLCVREGIAAGSNSAAGMILHASI